MKMLTLSGRTAKELFRDPTTLIFGAGFPLVLILLMSAIQANIPVDVFRIEELTPGMTVFGLSFLSLFTASLVSKDRESAFLQRLYAAPVTAFDFIAGYTLPVVPMALLQSLLCFLTGMALGLPFRGRMFLCLLLQIPAALFFICLGMLFGSILTVRQAGGICGALITNLTAWLSGIWFDLDLVGGTFKKIAGLLPFSHAAELQCAVFAGEYSGLTGHLLWVVGYFLLAAGLSVFFFLRQMKRV